MQLLHLWRSVLDLEAGIVGDAHFHFDRTVRVKRSPEVSLTFGDTDRACVKSFHFALDLDCYMVVNQWGIHVSVDVEEIYSSEESQSVVF